MYLELTLKKGRNQHASTFVPLCVKSKENKLLCALLSICKKKVSQNDQVKPINPVLGMFTL